MAPIQGLSGFSLRPDEILLTTMEIEVETPAPMDPESAQKVLGVRGTDGVVRMAAGGKRATWSPRNGLAPGRHTFVVGELLSRNGRALTGGGEVSFFVVESKTKAPADVAIESMVRLKVDKSGASRLPLDLPARGKYIELFKGSHRRTGAPVAFAADETGRQVDPDEILGSAAKARAERLGKFHDDLFARLDKARSDDEVHVAVWLRSEQGLAEAEKPKRGEMRAPPPASERLRKVIEKDTGRFAGVLRQMGGKNVRPDPAAPVVFAVLTKKAVDELARSDEVAGLFLYDPEGIEDLSTSIAVANSDDVHAVGVKGSGVKAAVWESGPDVTTNLTIAARYDTSAGAATSDHSRHVHGIIKNKEANKPKGHAPSCSLHSANSKDLDALRWAVKEKGCTVINQSFHRSAEPKQGTFSFDDIYKDWLALHWPWPTIVQAAGNFWNGDPDGVNPPSSEFVNHKGYNSLTVGNHNDDASGMSTDSVFRNPTSPHGDRELPELSANGTGVTTVGLTKSGTSMASPAAAGVAALLQSTDATLKHWPEGCRAILLAGATKNVVGNTWWQDVVASNDASDGTGAVNAIESHRIATSRRSRNAAATRRGWDVGKLTSADFDAQGMSKFSYRVQVPTGFLGPRRVKVALAWTGKVSTLSLFGFELPIDSRLTVDLDLRVFDANGAQVGYSGSWDNSYEIAEFTGNPGETYTIRIRRWSGTDDTWYGVAWTVTGGLLDIFRLIQGTRTVARLPAGASELFG